MNDTQRKFGFIMTVLFVLVELSIFVSLTATLVTNMIDMLIYGATIVSILIIVNGQLLPRFVEKYIKE